MLPVCPVGAGAFDQPDMDGVFCKAPDVSNFEGSRVFVRVDDNIAAAGIGWLRGQCSQRFWLCLVDPAGGP